MSSIEQQAITVPGIPKCMLLSPGGDYRCRVSLLLVRRKGVARVASRTTEMVYYAYHTTHTKALVVLGPYASNLCTVVRSLDLRRNAIPSVFTGVVFISERS